MAYFADAGALIPQGRPKVMAIASRISDEYYLAILKEDAFNPKKPSLRRTPYPEVTQSKHTKSEVGDPRRVRSKLEKSHLRLTPLRLAILLFAALLIFLY